MQNARTTLHTQICLQNELSYCLYCLLLFFFFFDFLSVSSVPIFVIEGQSRLFCVMGRILQYSTSSPTVPTTAFRDPVRAVSFTRTLSIGEPSTRKLHGVEQINCPWPQEGHLSFFSECFKKGIVSQEQYFQLHFILIVHFRHSTNYK